MITIYIIFVQVYLYIKRDTMYTPVTEGVERNLLVENEFNSSAPTVERGDGALINIRLLRQASRS